MTPPKLLKPAGNIGDVLPKWLRDQKRWAPWRARWNAGRGKFDKIPVRADRPEYGISTAHPERWFDFDSAWQCYQSNSETLAGIGFVLTGAQGIVGVDLDKCADGTGEPNEFARTVLANLKQFGAYCERSPSGNGFRAFGQCDAAGNDWVNHGVGLEVYAGTAPRFLTCTGLEVAL